MINRENFSKLREWVEAHRDMVRVGKPASDDAIAAAEGFLELRFPDSYVQFLKTWGTLALGPCEFYGITGADFEKSTIPNGIWFTALKRKSVGLPHDLVIMCDNNGDEYYCVDTSSEKIVIWDVITKAISGIKSDDLFEFILTEISDLL